MKKFIENLLGTMTKKITVYVGVIWGATVIMGILAPILWMVDLVSLVIVVSGTWGVVVSSYMYKSYNENKQEAESINPKEITENVVSMTQQITELIRNMK